MHKLSRFTRLVCLALIGCLLGGMPVKAAVMESAPIIHDIIPNSAFNNVDTIISIRGSDFQDGAAVSLGGQALAEVTWGDTGQLTAQIPWGINAGVYALSVTNPDGGSTTLENAFTLIQSIGVWTSDGPYGGAANPLVVDPHNGSRLFGAVSVGIFRSIDGASTWQKVLPFTSNPGLTGLVIKSSDSTIVLAATSSDGLMKSIDGGDTWSQLTPDGSGPIAYTSDSAKLYAAIGGQFKVSTNDGKDWTILSTLPAGFCSLAVDPGNDQVIYAGAQGSVVKSIDGGSHWSDLGAGIPAGEQVAHVVIDGRNPRHIFIAGGQNSGIFERSFDGGASWQVMTASGTTTMDDFSVSVSQDQIYAVSCGRIYRLLDDSLTWERVGNDLPDCVRTIPLDPATGALRYASGGNVGVVRSADNGQTWEISSQGITGLQLWAVSASAVAPEQVYATGEEAGAFASRDAGHSWTSGSGLTPNQMIGVAADPVTPCAAYVGAMWTVFKTSDCGLHWQSHYLEGDGVNAEKTLAVAIDPLHPNVVLAGGGRGGNPWSQPRVPATGMLYRSTDGGDTWTEITTNFPGLPINIVAAIAFSPRSGRAYLATGGWMGGFFTDAQGYLYISDDDGNTWSQVSIEANHWRVSVLVVDPTDADVVYATVTQDGQTDQTAGGIYKSIDGGESWLESDTGITTGYVTSLAVDPNDPSVIYAGSPSRGLFRSINSGLTWEHATGSLGEWGIFCLAAAAVPGRTFVYVCTTGGTNSAALQTETEQAVDSGVYQITLLHPNIKLYLPLVKR